MIVDPDFLEHWRTRMLVDALGGDEFAPFYLLRLWGHCQTRKATRFEIPAAGLKGLCKAPHEAAKLEAALSECGYVARDGAFLDVLKWAEQNASLIAAWENGSRGGRPPKPKENPRVSGAEPTGNPAVTQPEPLANPDETDRRGLDRSGLDKTTSSKEGGKKTRASARTHLPDDFYPDEAGLRALNGLSLAVELEAFRNHHIAAGSLMANWQAAFRKWVGNSHKWGKKPTGTPYQQAQRERVAEFAPALAKRSANPITTIDEVPYVPAIASR